MIGSRHTRPRAHSLNRLLPNVMTTLALSAGLIAMRFAIHQQWRAAVTAILIAAILDGLDGRLARAVGQPSRFGGEFDSLSDCVSFGVAPTVLLYLWVASSAGTLGWLPLLVFTICAALRLARFNAGAGESDDKPAWRTGFFIGVPTPAAAGLVMVPLYLAFEFGPGFWTAPLWVGLWTLVIAVAMVAPLPTFSGKSGRVRHEYVPPLLVVVGLLGAAMVAVPWLTILLLSALYVAALPFSIRRFRTLRRRAPADRAGPGEDGEATIVPLSKSGD